MIRHLTYRIAHHYLPGIEALAAQMGRGYQTLVNKLNINNDTHHLTIGELEMLADFTGSNLEVAKYFAQKGGAVVSTLPADGVIADMGILDAFMHVTSGLGQVSNIFMAAYADGEIDAAELREIESAIDQQIAELVAFKNTVREVAK